MRHNLDAKNLLLRSLQLQIRTYKSQRERQQQIFMQNRRKPTSAPASTPSPNRTRLSPNVRAQPSHPASTQTPTTPAREEEISRTSTTQSSTQTSRRTTTSTTETTATITNKTSVNSSSSNSDDANEKSAQSSSEAIVEVESEAQALLRTQNRDLTLQINRLKKQITLLQRRQQLASKAAILGVQTQADTVLQKKKKRRKQMKKKKKINSNNKVKTAEKNNQSCSSNSDPGGIPFHPKQSKYQRSSHIHQDQIQQQLSPLRDCVLQVLRSILRGNEALRHRLLDLQLGSGTNTAYAGMGYTNAGPGGKVNVAANAYITHTHTHTHTHATQILVHSGIHVYIYFFIDMHMMCNTSMRTMRTHNTRPQARLHPPNLSWTMHSEPHSNQERVRGDQKVANRSITPTRVRTLKFMNE